MSQAPERRPEVLEDNRDFSLRKHLYVAGCVAAALLLAYFLAVKIVLD